MQAQNDCSHIWAVSDYLPPEAILEYWCRGDARCRVAKEHAIMSACDKGRINFIRADGKSFSDDNARELARRGLLLIERTSFEKYAEIVDGGSPLPATEKEANAKSENNNNILVGALLQILLEKTDGKGKRYSTINSQQEMIDAIHDHCGTEGGLSKSNLEKKFALAKKAINSKD